MSGQWTSSTESIDGSSCFPRLLFKQPAWLRKIIDEEIPREALHKMVDELISDEINIALVYVESLIKTRPIKEAALEGRAHMAVLELENDPK